MNIVHYFKRKIIYPAPKGEKGGEIKMYAFIRNYKIEQEDYPVSKNLNTSKATLTLDVEVIEQGKQITPEVLIDILNSTQEFYKKNYFDK